MKTMRDAFFDRLYERAFFDHDIIVVDADMGAPSLDKFRKHIPSQFVNVGIAEQNAILLACGLALGGKKPFAYAIAPFITLRCYEQIKIDMCAMKLPVTCVGIGAGFSYEDSGPTHHTTEDIAIMRTLPHIIIFNPTDTVMASALADIACETTVPVYIRLDREQLPIIYGKDDKFTEGVRCLHDGTDICIITTGNMVHKALSIMKQLKKKSIDVGVIDVYRLKPVNGNRILQYIANAKRIITLEEHQIHGGLGSIIAELFADNNIQKPLKRLAIPDVYCYTYGGREAIRKTVQLDTSSILHVIEHEGHQ